MTTCVGVFVLGLIGLVLCPENGPISTIFGVIIVASALAVPIVVFIA